MQYFFYGFLALVVLDVLLQFAVLMTGFRQLKLVQDRAHLVLMYGVLVLLDCVLAHCDGRAWLDVRAETDKEVCEIWNRHSLENSK